MTDAAHAATHAEAHGSSSIKETVISILIAFAMAFVFRGFVIEPFLIPTGSMAPTLMGAHVRITDAANGFTWPAGPHVYNNNDLQNPPAAQTNVACTEPMTAQRLEFPVLERRSGDRIFVLKMPYSIVNPERFDVIVFRNPHDANENYIKRMVGAGNEHVALIDGDVFARPIDAAHPLLFEGQDAWSVDGWTIQRKPEHVQRAVWQSVFDSNFTPVNATRDGRRVFRSPWIGIDPGQASVASPNWKIADTHQYEYKGSGSTTLRFAPQGLGEGGWLSEMQRNPIPQRGMMPPFISDWTAYNDTPKNGSTYFPVSDIRLIADIRPGTNGLAWSGVIRTRGRDFRASLKADGNATLEILKGGEAEKQTSATVPGALAATGITQIEFWHVDQSLQLFIGGHKVAELDYDWTPAERTLACFGLSPAQIAKNEPNFRNPGSPSVLQTPDAYPKPEVWMEFSGGPFTLERTAIGRDIHYQATRRPGMYPLGTHPLRVVTLSKDQFFMCGDNSPASLDGRLWEDVDPWVAEKVGNDVGVVHRDLLIGKAFFVYFPSLQRSNGVPVPDFGRMRYIW